MPILQFDDKLLRFGDSYLDGNVTSPAAPADPWPTDQLVERWGFQDTLAGNITYDFAVLAGSAAYETGPNSDKALTMGSANVFQIDNTTMCDTMSGTNSWSVSMWMYITDNQNSNGVWGCSTASNAVGTYNCHGAIHNTSGYARTHIGRGANATDLTGWGYTSTKTWRHVVWTYDYGTTTAGVWVDDTQCAYGGGTALGSFTGSASALRYLTLNMDYAGFNDIANGAVCYMYLYNKELTSGEISTLYNSGTPI